MSVSKIKLLNFRNFEDKEIKFSPKTTLILGQNASGKTNILESLFFLSTGKSFKAGLEAEVISYDKDISRIVGDIAPLDNSSKVSLEMVITRGLLNIGAERPEKVPRKKLLVNGVSRRLIDFVGNFRTVFFGPKDLDLVTEAPSIRRKFLDNTLSQVDKEYRRALLSYEKGLRQRNKVLWNIREGNAGRDRLIFWDQLLIKNGDFITKKREELITYINSYLPPELNNYFIEFERSIISEGRLSQYKNEEVLAATTLVGPHRDDFVFKMKGNGKWPEGRDLEAYGSRGEQRMGVLWLKMAELNFIEKIANERPTLLLDDIFSELDDSHKQIVIEIIKAQQTIVTSVNDEFAEKIEEFEKIDLTR